MCLRVVWIGLKGVVDQMQRSGTVSRLKGDNTQMMQRDRMTGRESQNLSIEVIRLGQSARTMVGNRVLQQKGHGRRRGREGFLILWGRIILKYVAHASIIHEYRKSINANNLNFSFRNNVQKAD